MKVSPVFPLNIVSMCPPNEGRAERPVRERTCTNQTARPPSFTNYASICPASPAMGKERRDGGAASQSCPRSPGPLAPLAEVTQAPRARQRHVGEPAGGLKDCGAEGNAGGRPVIWRRAPPPGAAGNRGYLGSGSLSATLALCGPRTN